MIILKIYLVLMLLKHGLFSTIPTLRVNILMQPIIPPSIMQQTTTITATTTRVWCLPVLTVFNSTPWTPPIIIIIWAVRATIGHLVVRLWQWPRLLPLQRLFYGMFLLIVQNVYLHRTRWLVRRQPKWSCPGVEIAPIRALVNAVTK